MLAKGPVGGVRADGFVKRVCGGCFDLANRSPLDSGVAVHI